MRKNSANVLTRTEHVFLVLQNKFTVKRVFFCEVDSQKCSNISYKVCASGRLFTVPLFFWYASTELPPSWFVKASAVWGECLNYRGEGSGVGRHSRSLRSLDTLPRSRSLLQTKMAAVPSKRTSLENPTEK